MDNSCFLAINRYSLIRILTKKNIITLLFGVVLSTIALYLAFRNVPFKNLANYLATINYFWIFPSVSVGLISFGLRAYRWKIILQYTGKIGFWQVFHPLMIGFMLNCVLPGRAGEIARPIILYKKDKIPFSTGLATVAVERAFDTCLLILFFVAIMAFVKIDPGIDIPFGEYHLNRETLISIAKGIFMLCTILITGIILISLKKTRNILSSILIASPSLLFFIGRSNRRQLQEKLSRHVVNLVENFSIGFTLLKHPGTLFICFSLSFFIWTLAAFSYYLMMLGCPGIDLTYYEITAVMVIVSFFIALPSVPGFWGLWEAGGIFALYLFGINATEAAGFTLANHAVQIFPVIIAGLISAAIIGIKIGQMSFDQKTYI